MGRYVIYVPGSVNVDLCEVEVVGMCLFLIEAVRTLFRYV